MNDLIDRQAAIDAVKKLRDDCVKYYGKKPCKGYWELTVAMSVIKTVPSAQPERKKGKWIPNVDRWGDIVTTVEGYTCSNCGSFNADKDRFCPNCGADMRGTDE